MSKQAETLSRVIDAKRDGLDTPEVAVSKGEVAVIPPVDNAVPFYTMTKEEATKFNLDLDSYRKRVVGFKTDTHEMAYKALVHFHNTGDVVYIQKLFDILAEDKLLRSAAFGKWVLAYSPALFDDEKKKFSKNKNPNSGKALYHEDAQAGASLLAAAYAKRFWDMPGGGEKVNPSFWDIVNETLDKLQEKNRKSEKKGLFSGETAEDMIDRQNVIMLLRQAQDIIAPHTTIELMKATKIQASVKDAEAVEVTETSELKDVA